jgi:enoyl-[acyl-carrier protein] reductase III
MFRIDGQVALVTGSSRGIGRACALRLAEAGADVIVNYVTSQAAAQEVAEKIQRLGRRAALVKGDVSEWDDVQAMVGFVREKFGRLDILVSNAASGGFRPLLEANARHFEAAMNTNVRALMYLVQAAKDLLPRREGRSRVIALSSHGSHRPLPAYGLIGASKAALESMVRQLAFELGGQGVNCNVVLAGLVPTDSTRALPGAEEIFAGAKAKSLVGGRLVAPEDVANAVLFLASPLADLVQGQTLVVDGGEGLCP